MKEVEVTEYVKVIAEVLKQLKDRNKDQLFLAR